MRLAALLIAVSSVAQASSVDAVIAKMDAYLEAYEPRLSELIADEAMRQEVRMKSTPLSVGYFSAPSQNISVTRQLDSEVAFIALPQNVGWLGFRHVKTVNTMPVELADTTLTAALSAPGLDRARALLEESAKHNLGLPRTSNLPNLPLEFLHRRNRQRLAARLDGRETIRGIRTSRVVLVERVTPTVIRDRNTDADRPSVVRAWIDARDGRLLRAEVSTYAVLNAKPPGYSLRVEFGEDKALGLLVPIEMRETFPAEGAGRGTSVASYTNFRRFTTSARIVPQ
jgi:hypothetical protein